MVYEPYYIRGRFGFHGKRKTEFAVGVIKYTVLAFPPCLYRSTVSIARALFAIQKHDKHYYFTKISGNGEEQVEEQHQIQQQQQQQQQLKKIEIQITYNFIIIYTRPVL